jgi:hypothetical protein
LLESFNNLCRRSFGHGHDVETQDSFDVLVSVRESDKLFDAECLDYGGARDLAIHPIGLRLAGNYERTGDRLQVFVGSPVPEVSSLEASFLLQNFVEGRDVVDGLRIKLRGVENRKVGS